MTVSVIIVDDEYLARERIRDLLAEEKDFTLQGEAENGREAVSVIERSRPDLVLLDIELPELNGFEVIDCLPDEVLPFIIFMTAYDQYAVRAFEIHALDYLLKPIEPKRFREAMSRARRLLSDGAVPKRPVVSISPHSRIVVRSGDRIVFLRPEEIDWVAAVGNYVKIYRGAESFLLRQTMLALEERLPRELFARIQRSRIINVDRVTELHREGKDDYVVVLSTGARLSLGAAFRKNLEERLGKF